MKILTVSVHLSAQSAESYHVPDLKSLSVEKGFLSNYSNLTTEYFMEEQTWWIRIIFNKFLPF